jgi:hypothetical protein
VEELALLRSVSVLGEERSERERKRCMRSGGGDGRGDDDGDGERKKPKSLHTLLLYRSLSLSFFPSLTHTQTHARAPHLPPR